MVENLVHLMAMMMDCSLVACLVEKKDEVMALSLA